MANEADGSGDQAYEVITLFPCSGLEGFRSKNHVYRAKAGAEREMAIKGPTLAIVTIDEARAKFKDAVIEVSGSHTICEDCKKRDREINAHLL